MAPRLRAVLVFFLFTALGVSPVFAQLDRGQVAGFVKDQSGGVIPGATVVATSTQTGLGRTVITDERGYFVFPSLPPGQYDLSVELQGFRKWVKSGITLDASANIAVDATLETGAISETVTVIAKSTPLQTDVAVRQTVEAKDIELLSFSGRNPIGVVGLKAGVMGGAFNSRTFNDLGNGTFNINGSRADENTISIDGAIAVRTRSSGNIIGIQNVDAVQEVQVLTANYMPEFGRASGGQIRFVTKSGSNRYTGSASFFLRDDSLQANTWARNRSTNPAENSGPAPFNYKQYGYAFGGPVPFEGLRNRFFFFGAQEFVDYFAVTTNALTVPTEAMRRGDFSELLNPNNGFLSWQPPDHGSVDRPAIPWQRDSSEPSLAERSRAAEHLSRADARFPARHRERDSLERESAGSAERHAPARLPAHRRTPADVPLLRLQLGRGRPVPPEQRNRVPICADRLGPSQRDAGPPMDRGVETQPRLRAQLLVLTR